MHEVPRRQRSTLERHGWPLAACLSLMLVAVAPVNAQQTLEKSIQTALKEQLTSQKEGGDIAQAQADEDLPLMRFYQHVDQALVWQQPARVESLVAALQGLVDDGLTPSHYGADQLKASYQHSQTQGVTAQVAFDISATRALLKALDHLQNGKLNPREVTPRWDAPPRLQALPVAAIAQAVVSDEMANAFAQARPALPYYQPLRETLSAYRDLAAQHSAPFFPSREASLRPGEHHADVIILRQRLTYWGETGLLSGSPEAYPGVDIEQRDPRRFDRELEGAVKRFQRRHLLHADGVVGSKTRQALNASIATRVAQLRVNLERGRWMAPTLSREPHVWVDIAGYRMTYVRPNGERWSSRAVVGSSRRETPVIHSQITRLTVNPSWTLPPTIMREDMLPQLRQNPAYLSERGINAINYSGEVVDASDIDWASPGNIMLRQPPGAANPLGRVVVRFPNNEMIYLHDTPAQGLFGRDQRALSSGCVRVEGVHQLARMLLEDTGSRYRLEALINTSRSDINVNLPQHIPVSLHYVTAWPDEEGEITFREDIYRRDERVLNALNQR
ncbi:L,D-transpeptidase family protein [Halomonas llamarensis]|uniref:L,D-transpeptidase family protein n=1 Tax=Halomonas llamarensis TaxID=2945104 RepID=A0ABT0SPJ0_9GAMM|nr:L,D-transpeptidase family protein [Halomonas llamarensis]MCL7929541.1 L,D-transpeptidase family protein [Halomonas llamarensis]